MPPGPAGVEVKRDGLAIGSALWGTAVPVDPGRHMVRASAPGKETWETTITADQPGKTLTIEVPPLAEAKGAAAPPPPLAPTAPPPPPDSAPPRPWQRPLGIASLAVGAVGLGVGTAFGFMAKSTFDASNTSGNCDKKTNRCNDTGLEQRAGAVKRGNIGTGVFIAGAVLAAGGIVLWATAPSAKAPAVGVGPGSVAVRGAF